MLNLLVSLAVGAAGFAACWLSGWLKAYEAAAPGFVLFLIAYYVLARRTLKQLEALFDRVGKELQKQRFDQSVDILKEGHAIARWQFGIRSQVDGQIGVIYYVKKDFASAQPYLEKAASFGHWTVAAMLAVLYYKKKAHKEMEETFKLSIKKGKKQGLAWNLYAYCLCQLGRTEDAIAVLNRGLAKTKDDPKVKENLLALQNKKKMKMKGYAEQWYQFHLEKPPVQYAMGGNPFAARRRR